jgi:capsular polysaccharide biosynthesis protein
MKVESSWLLLSGSNYSVKTLYLSGEVASVSHFARNDCYGFTLTEATLVSPYGIVFLKDNALSESDFRDGIQDTVPMAKAWPRKLQARLRQYTKLGQNLLSAKEKHFVSVPFDNYANFLFKSIPKLRIAQSRFPDIVLLIPKSAPQFVRDFVIETGLAHHYVPNGSWKVKQLVILEREPSSPPSRQEVDILRDLIPKDKVLPPNNPTKIYISRIGSTRQLRNEEVLETFLQERGFLCLRADLMGNIMGNALLFSKAEVVIGPHGAGLANTIFCPPGALVCDLASEHQWKPVFSALAHAAKLNYQLFTFSSADAVHVGDAMEAIPQLKSLLDKHDLHTGG